MKNSIFINLKYLPLVLVCAIPLSLLLDLHDKQTTPDIIYNMREKAQYDVKTSRLVGGFDGYECVYNNNINDLEKDTLKFTLTIYGFSRTMILNNTAIKSSKNHWKLIKSDTTFREK